MDVSIDSVSVSVGGFSPFNPKGFLHGTYLWKTLWILTYVFSWLYFTQCLTSFSSINHLLCLYAWFFDANIDEVLSINRSTNVFVFGDFNIHHKGWLTYSGGTERPGGEFVMIFSISNDLTQMVNFSTQIPDCDSHSPALLDLFISSDSSICSAMAFPPLGNSNDVVFSVSIDFFSRNHFFGLYQQSKSSESIK